MSCTFYTLRPYNNNNTRTVEAANGRVSSIYFTLAKYAFDLRKHNINHFWNTSVQSKQNKSQFYMTYSITAVNTKSIYLSTRLYAETRARWPWSHADIRECPSDCIGLVNLLVWTVNASRTITANTSRTTCSVYQVRRLFDVQLRICPRKTPVGNE